MQPSSRAAERRRSRRAWRLVGIVATALAVVLVVARLALTPLVESRLRRSLDRMHGMRGTFDHVELSLLRLAFAMTDLRIVKLSSEGLRTPYVQVRRIEIGLYWKELLRGQVVGGVSLQHPKISLVASSKPEKKQEVAEAPQLGKKLEQLAPFRLDRFEVRDGEVLWIDANVPERPELWLHGVQATLENFATRPALARGEPSVLALSGTLQRSGQVSLFASADPAAKTLTFAGEAAVKGLRLVELGNLLAATQDVTPERGTLDLLARFECAGGHLGGVVRPVMKHPSVRQASPGLVAKIKALVADLTLHVLSDRVPGRDAVATTIPIAGDINRPATEVWPTVLGVVRNAFVAGLAESLRALPASPREGGAGGRDVAARRAAESRGRARAGGEGG